MNSEKDEHLVMLGGFGFNQKPLDTVEMFSPRLDQWSSLPVSYNQEFFNFLILISFFWL